MAEQDIARIKRNIGRMIDQGAPESEIDAYIAGEGVSIDMLKAPVMAAPQESDDRPNSMLPGGDTVNAFSRGAAEGIPIVGPLVAGAADQVGSHIASWITGRTPEEERALAHERMAADQAEQPVATVAGNVAGAVAGLAPLGATALGGKVLGMTGSLGQRAAMGAVSGAGIGGADAFVRSGGDASAAKDMVVVGGALGGGLPILGRGITKGWQSLMGKAVDPAETALARAMTDDQIPLDQMNARLAEMGEGAMVADLGPNLAKQARAIATLPGEGQKVVRDAVRTRQAGANDRLEADLQQTFGTRPVPSQVLAELEAGAEAMSPRYRELFREGTAPVDTSDLASSLDNMIDRRRGPAQTALTRVRSMLDSTQAVDDEGRALLDDDAGVLFEVRQAIDGMLDGEVNTKVIGALSDVRREIDGLLGEAVPGIKQLDAQYEEIARQREALSRGQQVFKSGAEAPRPTEVAGTMQQGAVPLRDVNGPSGVSYRFSQGALAELDRIVGTNANDKEALRRLIGGKGDWNRSRLASIFGDAKADRLLRVVEREKAFAETSNTILGGSNTGETVAAQREVAAGTPGELRGTSLTGLLASGLAKLASGGVNAHRTAANKTMADVLMAPQVQNDMSEALRRALANLQRPSRLAPASAPVAISSTRY